MPMNLPWLDELFKTPALAAPDTDTFAWLWQPKNAPTRVPRPETFRIRTLRLRGTLSQGLLMPLAVRWITAVS